MKVDNYQKIPHAKFGETLIGRLVLKEILSLRNDNPGVGFKFYAK